jgi:hypothetical protein
MPAPTYESISALLIKEFFALAPEYRFTLQRWRGEAPGAHIIYGDILLPYLLSRVRLGDVHTLKRIFDFLETLAQSVDVRVLGVVAFSVCEPLLRDVGALRITRRCMGPATLRILEELEEIEILKTKLKTP